MNLIIESFNKPYCSMTALNGLIIGAFILIPLCIGLLIYWELTE